MAEDDLARRVGRRIFAMRRARKMSRDELAAALRMSKSGVVKIEAGTRLSFKRLEAIAEALGCEPRDLFDFMPGRRRRRSPQIEELVALLDAAAARDPKVAETALRVVRGLIGG
jgi:transcriptional regulator with XRE-family HTH domain